MNEFIGKNCPFCKTLITQDEDVKVCSACGMPHHQDCWKENKGCTTFGCAEQHLEQHSNPNQPQPQNDLNTYNNISAQPSQAGELLTAIKSDRMRAIPIIFAAIGVFLLLIGIFYPIPSRDFSFREIEKYVGGDAYNAQIEAAIRGGEIAGAKAAKAIYVCGGLVLSAISSFKIKNAKKYKEEAQ